jgi:hypothetical protein
VILAADDQHIMRSIVFRAVFDRLQANVMVWIGRVPVKRFRDGACGHARADSISSVRSLLGVNGEDVVDRSVRRHDDGVRRDGVAVFVVTCAVLLSPPSILSACVPVKMRPPLFNGARKAA